MEITKEIIDNLPPNILYSSKERKHIKQFYKELRLLINEKAKKKESLVNIKQDIYILIKNIFPNIYQNFYYQNNINSLEIFIFCLCNQLESQFSKMVEGYRSFDFNSSNDSENKNKICSFLISFYDFFEEELVINNDDIINTVIETNNTREKNTTDINTKKEEINNSFIISILKIINKLFDLSISNDEFKNIFTEGVKSPSSKYYCLNDMGFLLIKILESIIKIGELSSINFRSSINKNININIDKNLAKFIQICYWNIVPNLLNFFIKIILNYNLNNTLNIILKKKEFITLYGKLSSIKPLRQRLLFILTITKNIYKPEQENYCKNIISKNRILDKIIKYINKDVNNENTNIYSNSKEVLSEIKLILEYYSNNNSFPSNYEELCLLINNILNKFSKIDKNCKSSFNTFFDELNTHIKKLNIEDDNKYKIYNFMLSLIQNSPSLSSQIAKVVLDEFKNNAELYQDMVGKTSFFNSFVINLHNFDKETIDYFFRFLIGLYKNFHYLPNIELTNILNSLTFFTDEKSMESLIQNLKEFNTQVKNKQRIKSFHQNKRFSITSIKSNRKKSNANINQGNAEEGPTDFFEEINQNFIDIVLNIINDIITQSKDIDNPNNTLMKPEMLDYIFDYIQEIIKTDSIYQYFSSKKFDSLFHSLVCITSYQNIAYKIIEVFLRSSKDKEHNEALIKLILNRFISTFDVVGKDEKKLFIIEINKLRELLLMITTLKVTFLKEALSEKSSQKNMNEKIVDFVLKYVDYINENKKNIFKVYNPGFHLNFKKYLEFLFELMIISNENVINNQNGLSPKLNYQNLNKIIYKTLLFFKELKNIQQKNNNKINNINTNENISKTISADINNLPNDNINENNNKIENISKSISANINYNNNNDYLLDIIKYFIDKSLNINYNLNNQNENIINKKFDEYYINKYKISKHIFDTNKNKNILSNFILQSPIIIILLLNNLCKLDIYLELFFDFIYLLCITNENNIIYLLRQGILKILLDISSNSVKYNFIILKILNWCFKFLRKEELKEVFEYLIKMFNNNNHAFTKDIIKSLNKSFNILTSTDYDYCKGIILSNYFIKQPNTYNLININNINLTTRPENNIIIKEEVYFYSSININQKLILLKLENEFFGGNKNKQYLEISLYNYDISVIENDQNSSNISDNKEANISLNAKEFINLNDVNIFNYIFNISDNKLVINVNGKNIYSYLYLFNFPNIENKKGNKYNNSSIFATVGYPLETIKEAENKTFFIYPHIKLISLYIKIENESKEKTNVYKMNINEIKLIDKPYDNLTNFKLDEDTMLISKYNSYESVKINSVYYENNLKIILYNNIFFINTYLSYSFDYTFRLEKYLFILLNSLSLDKDLFKLLINLLCSYFMINRKYLPKFLAKEEINSSLYFIIYKNAHYIDKSIIEIILPSLLSYDKLNSTIVTDILLDYQIFQKINLEAKTELLSLIDRKLLIDDYNLEVLLFEKLTNLLFLCCNDSINNNSNNKSDSNENNIDELIIDIICKIITKNSKNQLFINKVKDIFYILFNFHTFAKEHIITYNKGRKKETYQIISNFFKKMFMNDYIKKIKDCFIKVINSKMNLDKYIKNLLIGLCNRFIPKDNNYFYFEEGEKNFKMKAKEEDKNNLLFDKQDHSFDDNKYDKNNIRKKSLKIFRKDETEEISNQIMRKSRKRKTEKEDNSFSIKGIIGGRNESWVYTQKLNCVTVKINLGNNEIINCDGDCQLCKFIRKITKDLFLREIKFNIFEKYMLNNYTETYMFNNNLDYKLYFSYYLMKKEGISRIRKNFQLKVDKITNTEIDRSTEEIKKNSKKNDFQKLFNFYRNKRVSQCLCDMFNLAQIFDIELITECIDDTDSFKNCFNCLLFEGLNYINSVLVLGREKIYILTSVNISKDYILYSAINPIPRTFWVLDNYNSILIDQCKYLQMYDYMNGLNVKNRKSINDEEKTNINSEIFQKQEKGFQIYSFNYQEINELQKKRFLHQNNAIEIFLKNGKNYYLAFNIDLRDVIVGKIIQNLIDAQNNRSKNLIINNLLSNNNEYNTNNNTSNGGLNNPEMNSIQNSNDNGYLFEINNNSLSTVKNENMIFIRNINLFIEKEKNQSLKNYYKSKSKSKGKKNYCKITDIKEILDQALEKWSNGFLSTFSYIMILNTLSGRTFNNLAQYPVFPWILQDYSENEIDLNAPETFRDLSYPIYAQDNVSRDNLKEKYESFDDNDLKYHCGSHYSNCGFVCYYLIRIKPFSNIAAEIQGNCFDTPDRLFFNIQKFYIVKEKYQELIPDVFYLPELYININNYVYGKTTDNIQVLDVILPKWAVNSPRLFSKMNKKAIESQFVSQHINDWIDLIFGYKRSGSEAEKSYNVLKNIFSGFDPKKEEEDAIEGKINELCEMGIDPIQLFKKEHPKRDKHQINKAFLGRYKLLQCIEPRDSYQIKNFHSSSKIKEIYAFYENKGILSHGEGGLSSFRMIYENDTTFLKGKANDNKDTNIYFIVGEKKTLMPPSYKNFIEWGVKNIFNIVKPFQNKKYTFKIKHMKKFNINCIKISSNGKYIVLGYDNGVLEKYKLKKVNNCYIEEIVNVYNKKENNTITHAETTQEGESKISKKKKNQSKGKKILQKLFPFKKSNKNSEKDVRYNNISSASFHNPKFEDKNDINILIKNDNNKEQVKMIVKNHIIFNPQLSMSQSNILNSECFLLNQKNEKFIQYNSVPNEIYPNSSNEKDIEGYYCHSKNSSELKHLSKKSSNNDNSQKGYVIFLCNSSYNILSEVCLIDICDSYSFMLVVDKMNKLYLYNFNSFQLLRYIDISSMFTNQIKFSSICPYTGDFIVSSSRNVVLMSINGVFLSQINKFQSKISSCFISIIPMTESDLFLFTGHKDGNLIISKLVNSSNSLMANTSKLNPSNSNETINPVNKFYHEAYNACENNYNKYLNQNNLTLIFDTVITIDCSDNPIRYIKLKEDLTEIICIDNKNKIIYVTYEKFFIERKEKSNQKNSKNCPMCKSAISSSKILCHLCGKKLCSNCKVEKILPEYSFKNPKAICEECLQFINSTNKMLYDF